MDKDSERTQIETETHQMPSTVGFVAKKHGKLLRNPTTHSIGVIIMFRYCAAAKKLT